MVDAELYQTPPDLDWVLPHLAVGGRIQPDALAHLAHVLFIRRVIDVRAEEHDSQEAMDKFGIKLLHLPTIDLRPVSHEHLSRGVEWIVAAYTAGERVLVHCEYGIGRSALLACCALVEMGYEPLSALKSLKAARWKISPSPEQLHAFLAWCLSWHENRGRKCPDVRWEHLAEVAYSHLR